MENLYAIVDDETKIILSFPGSYSTAHYVTQGMLKTKAVMIPTSLQTVSESLKRYDLKNDVLKLDIKENSWVSLVPPHLISKTIIQKRNICRLRSSYIYSLEQRFLKISGIRSIIHFDEHVTPFLLSEIKRSNPETDEYSDGIVDYANIQSISPAAAYREIKMMLESSGLMKIRNQAWFHVFVNKFNSLTNKKQFDDEMDKAWNHFEMWRA